MNTDEHHLALALACMAAIGHWLALVHNAAPESESLADLGLADQWPPNLTTVEGSRRIQALESVYLIDRLVLIRSLSIDRQGTLAELESVWRPFVGHPLYHAKQVDLFQSPGSQGGKFHSPILTAWDLTHHWQSRSIPVDFRGSTKDADAAADATPWHTVLEDFLSKQDLSPPLSMLAGRVCRYRQLHSDVSPACTIESAALFIYLTI
jgi:hypothetical protein